MSYRSKDKTRDLAGMQTRHREIKALNYPENVDLIMELGAGHLNDIRTWTSKKIKTVIAIEMDKESLERGKETHSRIGGPNIIPVQADLTTDTKRIISDLSKYKGKVDHIIANFCIHFFLKDEKTFRNVCELVEYFIKPGGTFRVSTLDGKMVYDDLKAKIEPTAILTRERSAGGYYDKTIVISNHKFRDIINVRETDQNTIKMDHKGDSFVKIQRLYAAGEGFRKCGQMINVFVKSIGKYHNEYLVNFKDFVTPVLEEYGFIEMISRHFPDYRDIKDVEMSDAEKKYSSYHIFVEFRHTGDGHGGDNVVERSII